MNDEPNRDQSHSDDIPPPTGTLFVMGLYMLVLIIGWGAMFLRLLGR